MKPDSKKHNPDPKYLRSLIEGAGISQRKAAEVVGISPRTIRSYLAGERPIPYSIQFALECYFKHVHKKPDSVGKMIREVLPSI